MYKIIPYEFTSNCPYLNEPNTISIEYAEIPIGGQLSDGYKKMSYHCDYSSTCNHKDKYGRCPVYLDSPSQPE